MGIEDFIVVGVGGGCFLGIVSLILYAILVRCWCGGIMCVKLSSGQRVEYKKNSLAKAQSLVGATDFSETEWLGGDIPPSDEESFEEKGEPGMGLSKSV